jgi:HPt (histidine-containing phosphotransfer) domain-containing protein
MMAKADQTEAKLAELQQRYVGKLATKLSELEDAVAAAKTGDTDALTEAIRHAHKLHGTAGSYGFVKVSALVGQVETTLKDIESRSADPSAFDAVTNLLDSAAAAGRQGPS